MNDYEKSLNDLMKRLSEKGQAKVEKMNDEQKLKNQNLENRSFSISMIQQELAAYRDLSAKLESINSELKKRLVEQQKALEKEKKGRRIQFLITTAVSVVGIISAVLVGIFF